jgi:cytochrome P450
MRLEDLPEIDLDSDDFKHGVEHAEASIAHLRDEGPGMARSQRGLEIFRYDLSVDMLRDTRFNLGMHRRLASMGLTEGAAFDMFVNTLVNREGDAHTRMRKACASWFSPKMAERLRADIRALIDTWLDEAESDDAIDFQTAVGRPLPAAVFCKLVGEPLDLLETYSQLSEDMLKHAAPPQPGYGELIENATLESEVRVRALIAARREQPGDDVVSHMLTYEESGNISEEEIVQAVVTFLIGSTETTNAQICFNLEALAAHPDQWALLKDDPDLVTNAVLEGARFNPGVWTISRSPVEETEEYHGVQLEHYDALWPLVFAANRDPAAFDDPGRFDITRRMPKPPMNFGSGIHSCVGRNITLVEQQEVLRAALDRWSSFEVADSDYVGAMYSHSVNRMTINFKRERSTVGA